MVVFTCNHCGESLQKPRVEKHYSIQCRRSKSLTCVDCFRDFKNEEYAVHTKCITEEERYSAKGSIPGGVIKKGERKQESWTEMIRSIVQNGQDMNHSLRNLFNTISNYSNVPRKKAKFINFIKSSTGGRANSSDIEAAWDLIEQYKEEQDKCSKQTDDDKTNGTKDNGLKHKLEESDAPVKKKQKVAVAHLEELDKFSFKGAILNILQSKGTISRKKLQKKVLTLYTEETGNECTEKTIKKYNKKLKKLPNVAVNDDSVSIVTNCEK